MTRREPLSKLTAQWLRTTPAAQRWQTLQSLLSQHTGIESSAWTRRSSVICKWRALPASVSALTLDARG
jgi:hypothetical protein